LNGSLARGLSDVRSPSLSGAKQGIGRNGPGSSIPGTQWPLPIVVMGSGFSRKATLDQQRRASLEGSTDSEVRRVNALQRQHSQQRGTSASSASALTYRGLTSGPKRFRWGNAKLPRLLASLLDFEGQ